MSVDQTPELQLPFPLRDNMTVWLTLPHDLTQEEAERISAYIASLAKP